MVLGVKNIWSIEYFIYAVRQQLYSYNTCDFDAFERH